MSKHECTWFEVAWPDHECDCGARAVMVIDDDGVSSLVALEVPAPAPAIIPHQRMPLSA